MGKKFNGIKQRVMDGRRKLALFVSPDTPEPLEQPSSEDNVALRSLSPQYIEEEHGGYVDVLVAELEKPGDQAPLNIALTGHYGSGKSSVLIEAQSRLEKDGARVINLSMPSLGVGKGRLPKDGDTNIDRTNLIQKEIIKQLLYRRRPSETPASRYNRLDTFQKGPAYRRGAVIGLLATLLAALMGVPDRVQKALPQAAWQWLDNHVASVASETLQWASLLLVFVLATSVSNWVQRVLHQRLRVSELVAGTGPAKVTLSNDSSSYFDEYLDEIVYFFQTSRTNIVIFEDLDRFKDPHIFETLRELNLLLNNASQTGDENIRFVYAIRDSIFEQLSRASDDNPDKEPQPPAPLTPAEVAAARRLVTTNRTKFFDLVVPMVPFISHRTSRDLIRKELASVPKAQRPGEELLELVSAYITDMRLIKNICNEYDVFRTRILRESGLKELTPDKLFASVVYKNQYLLDYEAIRHGDSLLDKLYRAYRDWATESAADARRVERLEGARLRRLDAIASRSKRLGKRLQDVLLAREENNVNTTQFTVTTSATQFSFDDLQTSQFWRAFLDNQDDLAVVYQRNYARISANLTFAKVQTLLGEDLDVADWEEADRSEVSEKIGRATKDQRRFAHATLSEAMRATGDRFTYEGEEQPLEAVAKELLPEADLVIDLIRTGYIDENFTLYVTQFPDNSRAAAMNFIIRAVQPNKMDVDFHFGSTDEVSTEDIRAALDAERSRILDGKSVFNREIFDYLLGKAPESLHAPIRRLAVNAEGEEHRKFIDAYVGGGQYVKEFIALLGASWDGVFGFLFAEDPEAADPVLLSAALDGADPKRDYVLQDEERRVLLTLLPKLEAVTKRRSAKVSRAIATVLRNLGVPFDDISVAADQLAECVIADSNYAVSRHNLEVIMGSSQELSLDRVKSEAPDGVYANVLKHLPKYLEALAADPAIPTVSQQDCFVGALSDVHGADPDSLTAVATAAGDGLAVKSTQDIGEAMWRPVMAAGRLALTASNVVAYMDGPGLDSPLVDALEAEKSIEVDEDASEVDKLALRLVNSEDISSASKLALLDSLHLQAGSLDADDMDVTAHGLIPELVRRGEIADDADAFNALQEDDRVNKPALANISKSFLGYMDSLTLTANELYDLVAPASSDAIKEHVITNMDGFGSSLGRNGAASLIKWAAAKGRAVGAETLGVLIAKSEHRAAPEAIALLGPQVNEIELPELRGMLNSLGGSYAQLANPGRDRPRVPMVGGMDALLTQLKDAGIVSKYGEKSGQYRVSKHHA